ncbi:MAG: transposase [Nostoc sp. LLA-1]|nr:transposase [Cyanocohniella sp. LLY]
MKILTELLDLSGVKVISHRLHVGIGMILQVEQEKSFSTCPRCGTTSHKLHQNHRYIIKDLPFGEKEVFLEINRRQFKCEQCKKPFSENLDFVKKKRTYTKRLANKTIQEVLENDIHSVASKGIVTKDEIERMLKDASEELPNLKPINLKRLGIDEIALKKGHGNYCAVLVDLDQGKLITILSGRTQEIIKKTLVGWGTEILENIEEVSIDLWNGYKKLVTELMPNAQVVSQRCGRVSLRRRLRTRRVADRFHVMAQINKELDTQRKREKRQVEDLIKKANATEKSKYEEILAGLKNSKYPLLKNEDKLNEEQLNQLIKLKNVSPILKEMHEFKEKIRKIFNNAKDWYSATFKLGIWLSKAKKYFPNSNNTIIRWFSEIIAYFDNRTTSGTVEGINNKLKLIKRSGYGFRNFENFRIRCVLNWYFI